MQRTAGGTHGLATLYPPSCLISQLPGGRDGDGRRPRRPPATARTRRRTSGRASRGRPAGRRRPPRPATPAGRAARHAEEQRRGADHLDQRVADDRPGQQQPPRRRPGPYPAARRARVPGPVEQQQQDQHGHPGADVVRVAEQHQGRARSAAARGSPRPRAAPGPRPPRPGRGRGRRRRPAAPAACRSAPSRCAPLPGAARPTAVTTSVLGQLGGVERDVGGPPAVQQHVAVQHVPGLPAPAPRRRSSPGWRRRSAGSRTSAPPRRPRARRPLRAPAGRAGPRPSPAGLASRR